MIPAPRFSLRNGLGALGSSILAGAGSRFPSSGMGCESFRRCAAAGDGHGVLRSGGSSRGFGGRLPSFTPPRGRGGIGYVLPLPRREFGVRQSSSESQGAPTSKPLPSASSLGRVRRPSSCLERPGETFLFQAAEVFPINKLPKTTAGDNRSLPRRLFFPGIDLSSCAWVPPHCLRSMGTSRWSPPWCPLATHNFLGA